MKRDYTNQADIDKVQEILNGISPGLRISSCLLNPEENAAIVVGICLPVKGNAEIIKKLEAAGFRKVAKYKPRASTIRSIWGESNGSAFWLNMSYRVPKPPKEAKP